MNRMREDGLTEMQELFCREYLKDVKPTKAAIRAGYSENTASEQASRMLDDEKIQNRIQALMDKRNERLDASADTVLKELLKVAVSDLRKLFDEKGKLLPPDKWPEDVAPAVSSVEVDEIWEGHGDSKRVVGETKKVKFWDKTRGLELLGKHLKLFTEKHEHSGPNGGPLRFSSLTDEQLEERISALLGKGGQSAKVPDETS